MKKRISLLLVIAAAMLAGANTVQGQVAIKVNLPTTLVGTPNVGAEFAVGQQFSINADVLWAPYLFKKHEEVFRGLIGTVELRYYVNPKYYYTNDMFDGFYVGPYAMYGNFNIGLHKHSDPMKNYRYKGWGVSGGVSLGYKMYLSKRLRLDCNLGLGYAHMQYDKYWLGGEWANSPLEKKNTTMWIGPTKFGVHLTYNLFR